MVEIEAFEKIVEKIIPKSLIELTHALANVLIKKYEAPREELSAEIRKLLDTYFSRMYIGTKVDYVRYLTAWLSLPLAWWIIIRVIYETGVSTELKVTYVALEAYLSNDTPSVSIDFKMYEAKVCCICPILRIFSEDLGSSAKLSLTLNRNVSIELERLRYYDILSVWERSWDNKTVYENLAFSKYPETILFAYGIPKARAELTVKKTRAPEGYVNVEFPYSELPIITASKFMKAVWHSLAECCGIALLKPEEFEKTLVRHEEIDILLAKIEEVIKKFTYR